VALPAFSRRTPLLLSAVQQTAIDRYFLPAGRQEDDKPMATT